MKFFNGIEIEIEIEIEIGIGIERRNSCCCLLVSVVGDDDFVIIQYIILLYLYIYIISYLIINSTPSWQLVIKPTYSYVNINIKQEVKGEKENDGR